MSKNTYNADSIQILEGLEAVRKRPSMYIGDVSKNGFHHLVWEALDNSVDEALQKRCNKILITIFRDGSIAVMDNGAGIPVEKHKKANISALEVILTRLHAGGKFDNESYKVSGGLHGVGISVVNALSEWLEVEVKRNGKKYRQTFEKGKKTSEVIEIGLTDSTGTTVRFKPDSSIFKITEFDLNVIKNRVSELSYLMGSFNLEISLFDERCNFKETFFHPEGLIELIRDKNVGIEVINSSPIYLTKNKIINKKEYSLECVLQFTTGYNENILTFVNNINTIEGGTHLVGFKVGLSRVFNRFAKLNHLLKENSPSGEDLREGLTAVLSLKIPDPNFESQTKIRLGNREVENFVASVIFEGLQNWLEENPKVGTLIFNKALDASRARAAARKAREKIRRKSSMENTSLPFKLADCHKGTSPEDAELFLVEGDSAGGSAITGRAGFQAILPLRGKILNVEKAPLYKILEHKEIEAIVSAIGGGFLNEDFDIKKIRYHKIIIMTDADIDGSHIRTLLLTFFYRKMPNLIKEGLIYIARPPLYLVETGKIKKFIHEDVDLRNLIDLVGIDSIKILIKKDKKFLQGESLKPFIFKLNRVLKLFKDFFPKSPGYNFLFKEMISLKGPSLICLTDKNGELISKDRVQKLGIMSALIDTSQINIRDIIKTIEKKEPKITISFLEENEKTDFILRPIHFTEGFFTELKEISKTFYSSEGKFLKNNIIIETKSGQNFSVQKIEEVPLIIYNEGKKNVKTKRFKGLGEMEPSQLWDSTMDPEKRLLYRVELSDAIEADTIFNILMGSVVEPRRVFIEKHAKEVQELDV